MAATSDSVQQFHPPPPSNWSLCVSKLLLLCWLNPFYLQLYSLRSFAEATARENVVVVFNSFWFLIKTCSATDLIETFSSRFTYSPADLYNLRFFLTRKSNTAVKWKRCPCGTYRGQMEIMFICNTQSNGNHIHSTLWRPNGKLCSLAGSTMIFSLIPAFKRM